MNFNKRIGECLLSRQEILSVTTQLARKISEHFVDLRASEVGFVPVMDGAMRFCCALLDAEKYPFSISIHPMRVKTYQDTKKAEEIQNLNTSLPGTSRFPEHILIVEDIIDTGATSNALVSYFQNRAHSVTLVTLLLKKKATKSSAEKVFVGFHCPDEFVVGFGMDHNGLFRELNTVNIFNTEQVHV